MRLNLKTIEDMVTAVDKLLIDGALTDHDEIVGVVLERGTFRDDIEYSAYKRWLKKIYERRLRYRLQVQVA